MAGDHEEVVSAALIISYINSNPSGSIALSKIFHDSPCRRPFAAKMRRSSLSMAINESAVKE